MDGFVTPGLGVGTVHAKEFGHVAERLARKRWRDLYEVGAQSCRSHGINDRKAAVP